MPIIGRPRGYDQLVGQGIEKMVYGESKPKFDGNDKVVKESRGDDEYMISEYRRSPNFVKANYYLANLLHEFFPDNVPKISYIGAQKEDGSGNKEKQIEVAERKYAISSNSDAKLSDFQHRLLDDGIKDLKQKFNNLGLDFDGADLNFGIDTKFKTVYFDSFCPWEVFKGGISPNFDVVKMSESIDNLEDEKSKKICGDYLARLQKLLEEESKRLNLQII